MRHLLALVISLILCLTASAQSIQPAYHEYIATYAPLAVDQMKRHGIPASITLAQGLLESAAGRSTLAVHANNHFGIKVTSDWMGGHMLRDDDRPNEKFRVYHSAAESYEDHSLFLKRPRYQSLFSLSPHDYKGWARGLKACGYATSPTYADNLINIIELYQLHQWDNGNVQLPIYQRGATAADNQPGTYASAPSGNTITGIQDIVRFCNGARYVIAQTGDTWERVGQYYGLSARKLRRINELPSTAQLTPGDIVYLDSKSSRAAKALKHKYHVVAAGESMHYISQRYGMKLKTLYKKNKLTPNYSPRPGDQLLLR